MKGKSDDSREYLYGVHSVREALRSARRTVYKLMLASLQTWKEFLQPMEAVLKAQSIPLEIKTSSELTRICRSRDHQGIVAWVSSYRYTGTDQALSGLEDTVPLHLVLDRVQDPHNLGGILRTAHCCGVEAVFLPTRHSVGITPAVVKTSAGAAEHMCISRVGNLATFLERMKRDGIWIYGLESDGAKLWTDADFRAPSAIVVGGEGFGMRRLIRDRCDELIRLPTVGSLGCLNVSVACGVALYEVMRQRGEGRKTS